MLTDFPPAFAAAFASGVGLGFICCLWGTMMDRVAYIVRKVTRLGEDV